MATVKCPVCGLEGEEGGFCENCGPAAGRLCAPAAEPSVETPVPSVREAVQPPCRELNPAAGGSVPFPSLGKLPEMPLPSFTPLGSFGDALQPRHAAKSPDTPPSVAIPDGMPFGAQVTFAEKMWVGVASPIKIGFKAARDIYSDVSVSVLNGNERLYCRSHGCRPFLNEIVFSFNVRPRMPGTSIELTVRFECNRDGSPDPDVFDAVFPIDVYEEQAHHINIDASTIVSGTGASVLQYKNNIGGNFSFEDRRFGPVKNVTVPLQPSLAASPLRLTLLNDDAMIHLWALGADETVVCGRDDTCDYMLRVFDKVTGMADNDKSVRISRRHFRFRIRGGRDFLVADGVDAPSAYGTSIGEMVIGMEGVLFKDGKFTIDLGTKYTPRGVLSLTVDVARNRDDGSFAGFTIAREDGLDERVVAIVSRSVPLGDGAFAWDGKRFLFNGKKVIPGVAVEISGKSYEVRAYHQRKK